MGRMAPPQVGSGSGYTSPDVRAYTLQVQAAEAMKPALVVVDYVHLLRDVERDAPSASVDRSRRTSGSSQANRRAPRQPGAAAALWLCGCAREKAEAASQERCLGGHPSSEASA